MHARYFSPTTARFLSTDPAGGDPSQPQSWNRYSYVKGNPLRYVDPDGRVVLQPTTRRLRNALKSMRSTAEGEAAYQVLNQASGIYQYALYKPKLSKEQRTQLIRTGKATDVVTAAFVGKNEGPNFVSGGTINIDFSKVDRSTTQPYAGKFGDAAIMAHETGHGVDYEQTVDKTKWLEDSKNRDIYENVRERVADRLRDAVVQELEEHEGKGPNR